MANSGISIDDAVVTEFEKMRGGSVKSRPTYILFNFNKSNTEIVVEKISDPDVTFEDFQQELAGKTDQPAYAVVDFEYEDTNNIQKRTLFFVSWCPETAPIKKKMLVASSKSAIKDKLRGCQHHLQATEMGEIDVSVFQEQLKDCKKGK